VYITTGQDPEHGEGPACIWCIDATKRGDLSADLLVLKAERKTIVPHDKHRHLDEEPAIIAIPNPNSAVIWKYIGQDLNANGKLEREEEMHRTLAPVVIAGELVIATDISGFVHCLDRKTGRRHWGYDALAAIWSPPFVADGKVYITDEDGDVAIFRASADPTVAGQPANPAAENHGPGWIDPLKEEINMLSSCYTPATASKGVLFIASKDHLFAIERE
jgi:outer membrane protein assembly factor BamB